MLAAGACSTSTPPHVELAATQAKPPPSGPCKPAADLRARVPALLAKGKLDRAARAIEEANRLCPERASDTWAAEIAADVELGRYAKAVVLAKEIAAAPDAPADAKKAAEAALADAARLDRSFPAAGEARANAMRLLGEADDLAARTGDPAALRAAIIKYLASWDTWRPNVRALVGAGLAAASIPDAASAQRFFDRALAELSEPVTMELDHGLSDRIGDVVPFPDGRSIALVHGSDPFEVYIKGITILDARTLRARLQLRGHSDTVVSMAVSPDERILATGSQDRTARLWDTASGAPLQVLGNHGLYVESLAFSPDGERVATGVHHEVGLWNVASGARLGKLRGTNAVAFSPDGKLLASGTIDKSVQLWDAKTGAPIKELPWGTTWIRHVTFSPDGTRLAAGSYDDVRLWDASSFAVLQTAKVVSLRDLRFSPDGTKLLAEQSDEAHIWDARTGKLLESPAVRDFVPSPNGKLTALVGSAGVQIRDDTTGTIQRTIAGTRAWFLPSGKLLTTTRSGQLHLWDPSTGALLAKGVDGTADRVSSVAFSPDGKHLATGTNDSAVRRWDMITGTLLDAFPRQADRVGRVAYSPDGKMLATASSDRVVRLLDASTGIALVSLPALPSAVQGIAFSPDGKLVATSSSDAVRLWETATGAAKTKLDLLPDSESAVVFSPDGKLVAAGSGPKVWHFSLVNGAVVKPLEGHQGKVTAVAFSPDGKVLASGAHDDTVRLWDEATGKLIRSIHMRHRVSALAFSPDGKHLAVATQGITLLDAQTGAVTATPKGHVGWALSVAFSSDGKLLASGGTDGAVLLVSMPQGERLASLHAVAGEDAGFLLDDTGHVDFTGRSPCAARSHLVCRSGALSFPFDVCEERVRVPGLFAHAIAKEIVAPPLDRDLDPMPCAKRP
ncbi:High-affnity carbon uptake protein Hat/HatR [Minicystis rosea]|nr:High-affnity carbon uptake protein Hat/HatR [Minicystis rosea]